MKKTIFRYKSSLVFRTIGLEYLILKDTFTQKQMMDKLVSLAREYEKYIKKITSSPKNEKR